MADHFHKTSFATFVWNEDKARSNQNDHGVAFEEAALAFADVDFVYEDASRNDETRDAIIGRPATGTTLLYVVHLLVEGFSNEDERIRIISARRATGTEESRYFERWP